jgi:hypothetical protein
MLYYVQHNGISQYVIGKNLRRNDLIILGETLRYTQSDGSGIYLNEVSMDADTMM